MNLLIQEVTVFFMIQHACILSCRGSVMSVAPFSCERLS